MYDFRAFDDFRVSAWLSEGLMTKAENVITTVTASVKSAGLVVASAILLATSQVAVAKIGVDAAHTVMVSSTVHSGQDFESVLSRLTSDNQMTLDSLGVEDGKVHPLTLDSAEKALERINKRGVSFDQDWLMRMQSM